MKETLEERLWAIADEQGWDKETMFQGMLSYLYGLNRDDHIVDYFQRVADIENKETSA